MPLAYHIRKTASAESRNVLMRGIPRAQAGNVRVPEHELPRTQQDQRMPVSRNEEAANLDALTTQLQAALEELRNSTEAREAALSRLAHVEKSAQLLRDVDRAIAAHDELADALDVITSLLVPRLADACVIQLSEPAESLHYELGESASAAGPPPPLYAERMDDAGAEDPLRRLRAVTHGARMVVPLRRGDAVIGSITVYALARQNFGAEDLELARQIALRVAALLEQHRLRRELAQAVQTKSEFLARMSHELRTPLNAISGYTDLLQLGVADPAQEGRYLDRIRGSTFQLLSIIEEILAFSRLEAGAEEVRTHRLDATEIAREVERMMEIASSVKGLHFELEIPETPVPFDSDRLKVLQILMNLLSNAVKFTDSGQIRLTLDTVENDVIFRVQDTGCGIRADALDEIFEPFWQAEAGITRRLGGTGLGLSVARRLTDLLGGHLEVDSVAGAGSTFTLRLPGREAA
jgi:signal transduction histidine kinase